jgi:hypothetical protein
VFDKRLRLFKQRYQRGQLLHLEEIRTRNPQLFWSQINKLGPKRHQKMPMEVRGRRGLLVGSQVTKMWQILKNNFIRAYGP